MAGSKFQYDESGGTFFYFLLSFLALVVIPCTYYFWPKDHKKGFNFLIKLFSNQLIVI
jgi:translocation protein SEC63